MIIRIPICRTAHEDNKSPFEEKMDYTSHFPLAANDWQKNGTSFYLKKVTDDWIVYFMADFTNLQLVYET